MTKVSVRQFTSSDRTGFVPLNGVQRAARLGYAKVGGTRFLLALAGLFLTGCSMFSATGLRCGTDGDSSYVEVTSAPQAISQNVRALSELCAFAYEGVE